VVRITTLTRTLRVTSRFSYDFCRWKTYSFFNPPANNDQKYEYLANLLSRSFQKLGPTFVKLGQFVASGEGLFPPFLTAAFRECRDQVPPERFTKVRHTFKNQFGQPFELAFKEFDSQPIAAASIAQVYSATLLSGEPVVVKIQRSNVARIVQIDIKILRRLSQFLIGRLPFSALLNPPALVELFEETILEELDFRVEAENMRVMREVVKHLGQDNVTIPELYEEYTRQKILVMERIQGFSFADAEGMQEAKYKTDQVLRICLHSFLESTIVCGVFHGDMHAGNIIVPSDDSVVFIDFGIIAKLNDQRRLAFVRLLLAITTNDINGQMQSLLELGAFPADTDIVAVTDDLGLDNGTFDPFNMKSEELVREFKFLIQTLLSYGAKLPKELMLFAKNMMILDGAISKLAPDLDILTEITTISQNFATKHGEQLGRELGVDPSDVEFDMTSVKLGLGIDSRATNMTYKELQARRELIQKRMRDHVGR
jgi:ubiquinone biosynthesis protein